MVTSFYSKVCVCVCVLLRIVPLVYYTGVTRRQGRSRPVSSGGEGSGLQPDGVRTLKKVRGKTETQVKSFANQPL